MRMVAFAQQQLTRRQRVDPQYVPNAAARDEIAPSRDGVLHRDGPTIPLDDLGQIHSVARRACVSVSIIQSGAVQLVLGQTQFWACHCLELERQCYVFSASTAPSRAVPRFRHCTALSCGNRKRMEILYLLKG